MTLGYVSTCWVACNLTRHIFNKFNILMHFFSNIQISINISQYAVFDTISFRWRWDWISKIQKMEKRFINENI